MGPRIYPSQQDTNLNAKGSLILSLSASIDFIDIYVNNILIKKQYSEVIGLYSYGINIGDIIRIEPSQSTLININRLDYTTDDINNDNGIRNSIITGLTSTSYTFTATTVSSGYNFEYNINVGVFAPTPTPTPTPTSTPIGPTATPTPTSTPIPPTATPTPTPTPTPIPFPITGSLFYYDPGNITSYPGSGSILYDISGNERHANINTGITWVSGSAAYFDLNGTDNNSITGTTLAQTFTSWSMWIAIQRDTIGDYDGFMTERTGPSDLNGLGSFSVFNQFDFNVNNNLEITEPFPGRLITGSWMFLGGAIDNTTYTTMVYKSGSIDTYVTGSKATGSSNFNNAIVLGEDKETGTDRTMDGRIGPAVMFDRKLSTTELTQINDYFKTKYGI